MDSPPLFSIIIPTYNRANLLKKAVQSVLDQTFRDWELIIVDDGSADNTADIAQAFSDSRIRYIFQEHQERSTARSLGISHASGHYVCFMDDDDYILEQHLQVFFDALSKDGFPAKIYRNGFYFEKGNKRTEGPVYDPELHPNPVYFAAFNFCGAWSLCIPKVCLLEDRFPEQFPHWQDTHLIIRLFAKHPFQQNSVTTYIYVQHALMGSQSIYQRADAWARIQSNVGAIKDFFERHGNLVKEMLPKNTAPYLAARKYIEHANGALLNRKFPLAWKLFIQSLEHSQLRFLKGLYLRFLIKFPLKLFLNIP